ncbi:MAG: hypothetical protein KDD53_09655 [Bdellovibrionales bacterium]|nr:hypothetical protein [Bdellovibrionales bacterium]
MNTKPDIDINSDRSWQISMKYASLLAPFPPQLGIAFKKLRANGLENVASGTDSISSGSISAVRLIDKTPTLKTPLYFAASSLYPDRFSQAEDDTSKALLRVLGPGLFSSLLAVTFLYRRVTKFYDGGSLTDYRSEFRKVSEIGFLYGSTVSDLGPGEGLLISSVLQLALGTFMMRNDDAYQRYRNLNKLRLDIEFEHSKWGCDHTQVATHVLKMLGVGRRINEMRAALLGKPSESDPSFTPWANLVDFINRLRTGESGDSAQKFADSINRIVDTSKTILRDGSSFTWMERGFTKEIEKPSKEQEDESQEPEEEIDPAALDIPGFSTEELAELSQEELKQLKNFSDESS